MIITKGKRGRTGGDKGYDMGSKVTTLTQETVKVLVSCGIESQETNLREINRLQKQFSSTL